MLIVFLTSVLKKCLVYIHDWITLDIYIQLLFATKNVLFS